MFHIYRRVSCAVMIALMGFTYTLSTANAELQQGNPEISHPTIYKQKHLQEIGQVAQRQGNRSNVSRSSKVRMLKYLDRSCKQGNINSCMRFGRFSERYPGAVKKMGLVKRVAQARRQVATSKVRLLTRLHSSCDRGSRSACNRYAAYSKRFPVAASKIRATNKRVAASKMRQANNRRAASKVRLLTRLNASCKRGIRSSCNRYATYSKRFPVAASKIRQTIRQTNRRVASKVRLLTRLNFSCKRGIRSSCNRYARYSKRFPVAASKIRQATNRRVASKVRLLTRLNFSCKKGNRSSCNRYARYSKRFPVAASKIRQATNRRAASKVRMLRSMDNSCRTLKNAQSRSRACNRFSNYASKYVRAMFK